MPSTQDQPRNPVTLRLKAEECDCICAVFASLTELEKAETVLSKRLQYVENGKQDLSTLMDSLQSLVKRILATVPADKLVSLRKNMKYMHYRVYPVKPVSLPEDETVVLATDISTITRYAHQYACIACNDDCNTCDLGRALDRTLIQCRSPNERWTWIDPSKDYTDQDAMLMKEDLHDEL